MINVGLNKISWAFEGDLIDYANKLEDIWNNKYEILKT